MFYMRISIYPRYTTQFIFVQVLKQNYGTKLDFITRVSHVYYTEHLLTRFLCLLVVRPVSICILCVLFITSEECRRSVNNENDIRIQAELGTLLSAFINSMIVGKILS